MKARFDDFKETIALALQNNMPLNAKLILVGRISYALEYGELNLREAKELEDMMGGRDQWHDAYEMAISGSIESSPYQMTP